MDEQESKAISDLAGMCTNAMKEMDDINKRLIIAVIAVPLVVCAILSSTLMFCTYQYFTYDLSYPSAPEVTNTNTNTNGRQ